MPPRGRGTWVPRIAGAGYSRWMEPLYAGRVRVTVKDTVLGAWALPLSENMSVGRVPGAGIHIPNSWVPSRLCRFIPYEQGWLVQLGRARGRVTNKYLGDVTFAGRTIVALQPGRAIVSFPELDDVCRLDVVIGASEADGLPMARDRADEHDERTRTSRTSYAIKRVDLLPTHRLVLAVTFAHLLTRARTPDNLAAAAAVKLGKSEASVRKVIFKTRDKINLERWLNLRTTDQLGHYLVNLTGELTEGDLPPQFRGDQGVPG